MSTTNLSEVKANQAAARTVDKLVPTTVKFDEMLEAVKTNNAITVIAALNDLFDDFEELRYLLSQFAEAESVVRPFLGDEDVVGLLKKTKHMIELDSRKFDCGIEELDKDGGSEVRAINIKQDLVVLYSRLVSLIRDVKLREIYSAEFAEVQKLYESFNDRFVAFLRNHR